jgi:hypothetical protein
MKTWIKLFAIISTLSLVIMAGCSADQTSDEKQQSQQEKILKEATKQTGMPNITHFFERKMMKDILELRDNPSLITYVYTQNEMDGRYVYLGKAIGFGLPYATQYTNPEKAEYHTNGNFPLPQADPNGLFSPSSADATWIMMINPKTNEPEVSYLEPKAFIVQNKLDKRLVEPWSLTPDY